MRTTWRRIMKTKPLTFLLTLILSFTCLTGNSFGYAWQDLSRITLKDDCPHCDLSDADFRNSELHPDNENLQGLNLYWANLQRANLTGVNLTGANLSKADLTGANLQGTNLTGVNLTGADLTGAVFDGAILTGVKGADLTDEGLKRRAEEKRLAEEESKGLFEKFKEKFGIK